MKYKHVKIAKFAIENEKLDKIKGGKKAKPPIYCECVSTQNHGCIDGAGD